MIKIEQFNPSNWGEENINYVKITEEDGKFYLITEDNLLEVIKKYEK